jgi:hypothetical protein
MITSTPRDELAVVHERGGRLRAEAEAERLRGPSTTRHALAASLRRAADRLDRAPFARIPASQS